VSIAAPLLLLVIAAALFFVAQRFGWRGVALVTGVPLALMVWLWLALKFYWIAHTGDDDAEVMLFLVVIWFVFASVVSAFGLAFRKKR
jgi:hypothetical protein